MQGRPPGVPPEWSLGEGDELGVGPVRFRVHVYYPVLCEDCWEEIPEDQLALAARTDFGFRCLACTQEAEKRARPGERSGEMMGML